MYKLDNILIFIFVVIFRWLLTDMELKCDPNLIDIVENVESSSICNFLKSNRFCAALFFLSERHSIKILWFDIDTGWFNSSFDFVNLQNA